MARRIEDEIDYYYDSHPTEEDLMGETSDHADLVHYLVEVLTWLFREQNCAIYENLNIYQTTNKYEYPLAPDIAIFKGVIRRKLRSWKVGSSGPAPQVVFEIASEETWAKDLDEKPARYAQMGVQEYYAYDPNEPPLPRSRGRRLFGWQRDQHGMLRPMTPANGGALWSPQVESWLVPDGAFLRLYDRAGQVRLTRAEEEAREKVIQRERAEAEARQKEIERKRAEEAIRRAELEQKRAEEAIRRAEAEAQQKEIERQRAEEAIRHAEAEAQRNKLLEEKLRSLGIDPEQLI
jgi:Uma2 family endonuclease